MLDQFPQSGDGITVNLTILPAGERANVIPATAMGEVDVRVQTKEQLKTVRDAFEASARNLRTPDTKVQATATPAYPPLPTNRPTDALTTRAKSIYTALGCELTTGGNGGASESALAYEGGTPALDRLGPVGGGFHSIREYLGARPPQRMK